MCKNVRIQRRIVEEAKHETPVVFALFDLFDERRNLIGLVKVYEGVTAECWTVHRYGDTELYRSNIRWGNPNPKTIFGWFGVDSRGHELVPC